MACLSWCQKLKHKLWKNERIGRVDLTGVIAENPKLSDAPAVLTALDEVEKKDLKALLVHINSPGGTVGQSQAIYDRLMALKKDTDCHIVAHLGDVCASGGGVCGDGG